MKKTLFVLSNVVASAALAGSLNFDMRFDMDNASFDKDGGKPKYMKYYMQTGRVDWNGKATEDLSYRLRLRFDKDQGAVNKRDSLNNTVDFAYLGHKMGDFTLVAGKFDVMMNGFEGATAGPDLYFKSIAYGLGQRYMGGVAGAYTMGDHSFTLANVNNVNDATEGANFNQTHGVTGLIYKGAFMEKAMNVMASYHTANTVAAGGASTKDGTNTYTTVGVKYAQGAWGGFFQYDMFSMENSGDATKSDKHNSMLLDGFYNLSESMTLKAKIESATYTSESTSPANKIAVTGTGLAFEYKPIKDTNFRYHVAYTTQSTKSDASGAVAAVENHMIAGVRLNADFLK